MTGDTVIRKESSADARDPPSGPLRKAIVLSGRKVARSRSIERNDFAISVFTISCLDDFQIRDFFDFDRATIAK
jgi:hypothetical protein